MNLHSEGRCDVHRFGTGLVAIRTGLQVLFTAAVIAASAITIGIAPPASTETPHPPGITLTETPPRQETPGNVEISTPREVEFPRPYPDFGDMGVYHHGRHHHC